MAEGKLTSYWEFLTGSNIAAFMGLSPYMSRQEVVYQAIQYKHGKPMEYSENEAMRHGNWFEEHIAKYAAEIIGLTDLKTEFGQKFVHPFYPVEVSLDATAVAKDLTLEHCPEKGIYIENEDFQLIDGNGVMEIKLTNAYPPADNKPEAWRGWVQLKTQVSCLGASWGVLVVFHHAVNQMRMYFYARDMEFEKELKELAEDWQVRVHQEKYFDPETSHDAWLMLKDNELTDDVLELPKTSLDLCAQYEYLTDMIKTNQKHRDLIQKTLMLEMGNHEKAVCGGYHLDWGYINYKPQPEKVVPAKEGYQVRKKSIRIKDKS